MRKREDDEIAGSRLFDKPESIVMHGFRANCRYCRGSVMMSRNQKTLELLPDNCWCCLCGQPYFADGVGDIAEYEGRQWREKFERENRAHA